MCTHKHFLPWEGLQAAHQAPRTYYRYPAQRFPEADQNPWAIQVYSNSIQCKKFQHSKSQTLAHVSGKVIFITVYCSPNSTPTIFQEHEREHKPTCSAVSSAASARHQWVSAIIWNQVKFVAPRRKQFQYNQFACLVKFFYEKRKVIDIHLFFESITDNLKHYCNQTRILKYKLNSTKTRLSDRAQLALFQQYTNQFKVARFLANQRDPSP